MQLRLVHPARANECRCYRCNKLLAKIKSVDKLAFIEIKCTRARCGALNVFKIEKNEEYTGGNSTGSKNASGKRITRRLQRKI